MRNLRELLIVDPRVGRERQLIKRLQAEPEERVADNRRFENRLKRLALGQRRVFGRQFASPGLKAK